MSESSAVEIDFFRIKEESSPKKLSGRRNIQDVISKINPELLKPAIASAFANNGFVANKSFTSPLQLQTLPVYNQDCGGANMDTTTTSLTIFYNGTVSVFDVSPNQADNIMKLADSVNSVSKTVVDQPPVAAIGGVLNKDLPLSRKKSLKRFLEKRKERQVSVSPYAYSQGNASLQ
ncbi:hypothetical protein L1987_17097 [Smallanthus sonchifolius]|uniref:Uncharacterized protein n=1 Tax=Smallanthus sonchifolius TaxID=185202 RepID=A0ACB9IYF7_9ASTR|nr:hypothetical protein L1987_17097 [Smallanthus sonchifolius]